MKLQHSEPIYYNEPPQYRNCGNFHNKSGFILYFVAVCGEENLGMIYETKVFGLENANHQTRAEKMIEIQVSH